MRLASPSTSPCSSVARRSTERSRAEVGAKPGEQHALDVQQALWDSKLLRAAAAFDCLIAAYAVVNDAVILNSDRDFGYIEIATQAAVRQEYVAA